MIFESNNKSKIEEIKKILSNHEIYSLSDKGMDIDVLEGYIFFKCRVDNGFGFDEIFEVSDGRTLSELFLNEKNDISVRTFALKIIK